MVISVQLVLKADQQIDVVDLSKPNQIYYLLDWESASKNRKAINGYDFIKNTGTSENNLDFNLIIINNPQLSENLEFIRHEQIAVYNGTVYDLCSFKDDTNYYLTLMKGTPDENTQAGGEETVNCTTIMTVNLSELCPYYSENFGDLTEYYGGTNYIPKYDVKITDMLYQDNCIYALVKESRFSFDTNGKSISLTAMPIFTLYPCAIS